MKKSQGFTILFAFIGLIFLFVPFALSEDVSFAFQKLFVNTPTISLSGIGTESAFNFSALLTGGEFSVTQFKLAGLGTGVGFSALKDTIYLTLGYNTTEFFAITTAMTTITVTDIIPSLVDSAEIINLIWYYTFTLFFIIAILYILFNVIGLINNGFCKGLCKVMTGIFALASILIFLGGLTYFAMSIYYVIGNYAFGEVFTKGLFETGSLLALLITIFSLVISINGFKVAFKNN